MSVVLGIALIRGQIYLDRTAPLALNPVTDVAGENKSVPFVALQTKTILRLGIPSGAQMIVIYAGMTVILSIVNAFGEGVVAGFGAAQRLGNIILLPAIALGIAVNAMAAQNIGTQKWDRVSQITQAGIAYNLGVMLAIAAILFVFAEPLVRLFIQEAVLPSGHRTCGRSPSSIRSSASTSSSMVWSAAQVRCSRCCY